MKKKTPKTKIPAASYAVPIYKKFGYDGFSFVMEPFPITICVILVAPKKSSDLVKELNHFYRLSPSFRKDIPKKLWDDVGIDNRVGGAAYHRYFPEKTTSLLMINYRLADLGSLMHDCDHIMTQMAEYGLIDHKSVHNQEFWAYTYTALVTKIYNRIRELGIRLVTY